MGVFDCVKEENRLATLVQRFSLDTNRTTLVLRYELTVLSDAEGEDVEVLL